MREELGSQIFPVLNSMVQSRVDGKMEISGEKINPNIKVNQGVEGVDSTSTGCNDYGEDGQLRKEGSASREEHAGQVLMQPNDVAKGDRSTSPLGRGQHVSANLHDRQAAIISNPFHLEIINQRKKGVRSPTLHKSLLRKSSLPKKVGMSNLV